VRISRDKWNGIAWVIAQGQPADLDGSGLQKIGFLRLFPAFELLI
jgi:hypothetical protein